VNGDRNSTYTVLVRKVRETDKGEDLGADEKIILKWFHKM
jgi:hypothetical protein